MDDQDKQVPLVGTVKESQWTNPHGWIQVLVLDPDNPHAAPLERGVEMASRVALIRRRWKPATLKVGDKIKVVISPLREGQRGGLLVRVTL